VNGDLETRIDPTRAPSMPAVTYKYDALGRRVARIKGSEWTRYTYDGDDVVLDENSNGSLVYYGNGPGIDNKLWYQQGSSSPVFFLTDHLGSTRALVSSTGSIIGTMDYDAFGKPLGQMATRYQYAGREWDPDTELYYYRARWYDPAARRFISEDPIGLNGGINLYAYVENNSVNFTDPMGLQMVVPMPLPLPPIVSPTPGTTAMPGSPGDVLARAIIGGYDLLDTYVSKPLAKILVDYFAKGIDKDTDLTDPSTWPTPPVPGKCKEGDPSRSKPRSRGEKSLWDPEGGEWRPHKPDVYHPEGHWDYKPAGPNNPWINVPVK
jgi:RHS repeat-associated protein